MKFKLEYIKPCNEFGQVFKLDITKKEHNIICTELDNFSKKCDFAFSEAFSADILKSELIFRKIVKYEAITCTVCEIVEDLIC